MLAGREDLEVVGDPIPIGIIFTPGIGAKKAKPFTLRSSLCAPRFRLGCNFLCGKAGR